MSIHDEFNFEFIQKERPEIDLSDELSFVRKVLNLGKMINE